MSAAIKKEYRANNGEEMIQAILKEFELALRASNKFPLHLAFHNWSFVGGIKLKSHHMKQPIDVKFSGKDTETDENVSDETHEVDEITVQVEHLPQPPDKVRELIAEKPKTEEIPTKPTLDEALEGVLPTSEPAVETMTAYRVATDSFHAPETQPESQQAAVNEPLGAEIEPSGDGDAKPARRPRRSPLSGWKQSDDKPDNQS